jgi:F0F1-type ATP synthase assembly protein I
MARYGSDENSRKALRASAVSTELAVAIIGGLLGGNWVDGKLGTGPWLALGGLLLGCFVGFRALYRLLKSSESLDDDSPSRR